MVVIALARKPTLQFYDHRRAGKTATWCLTSCTARWTACRLAFCGFYSHLLEVGLAIGILQAATSIQEMTLTFVPKLILVVVAFGLLANFMMVQLTDYFSFIFDQVAQSA